MRLTRRKRRKSDHPHRFATAEDRLDVYRRVASHDRSLWITTISVVVMSAATIALLTLGSAMYGAFRYPSSGYVLAGASFVLLALFIVYVIAQRETFERNRKQIFRELESRSGQLGQSNEALKAALNTQEVFLNTVSHELKTPLTCILAYAEFLSEQELDRDEVRTHAQAVLNEGKGLMRLIEQMVDVTRFRSGTFAMDCDRADLNEVLGAVLARARNEALEKKLVLLGELDPQPLPVRLDLDRMPRALDDLLRNVFSRCGPGCRILVRSRQVDEGWAEFTVEGCGESVSVGGGSSVFRPFAQLNPEPKGRSGDLGLTLPLLKRYITAHGGIVQVNAPGSGRFELTASLPLAALPPRAAEAA